MKHVVLALALWPFGGWAVVRSQGMQWSREFTTQGPSNIVHAMTVYDPGTGPSLVVGGQFNSMVGFGFWQSPKIARWDGTTWHPIGLGGFDGYVFALATYDPGTGPQLFAGGEFDWPHEGLAMWNGSAWVEPWGVAQNSPFGTNDIMTVLCEYSGELYVGGYFWAAGSIGRWDGTTMRWLNGGVWNQPTPQLSSIHTMCVYDDGAGPQLYVTGTFTQAGSIPAAGWARWNGSAWSTVGNGTLPSFPYPPEATVVYDDGSGPALYASATIDGSNRGLVRWDGQTWSEVGDGLFVVPTALRVFDDGTGPKIYAFGLNLRMASNEIVRMARLDGNSWVPLGAGSPTLLVSASENLEEFDPGTGRRLYFGTGRTTVAGIPSIQIAAWVASSGPVSSVCPGDGTLRNCPCSLNGAPNRGCANSFDAAGASLDTSGSTATDDLTLLVSEVPPIAMTLFMQSEGFSSYGGHFGDGLRCLSGPQIRLRTASAAAGQVQMPAPGGISLRARVNSAGDPLLPGAVRYYQAYYRDVATFCIADATFNATNGVRVVW